MDNISNETPRPTPVDFWSITILYRDVNGKKYVESYENDVDFANKNYHFLDDTEEEPEILMVTYFGHCIYNALSNDSITMLDLFGFFG